MIDRPNRPGLLRLDPTPPIAVTTGVVVCLCLMTACQSVTGIRSDDGVILPPPSGPGLVARSRSLIPDVPTPVGFVGVASKSNSYVTREGLRIVDHTYQGRASIVDAVQFYRLHLPQHGWQRKTDQSHDRITLMTYAKGREILQLRITDRRIVDVQISIRGADPNPPVTTNDIADAAAQR